jgi:hypothetical protein
MTAFYRSDRLWNPAIPIERREPCPGGGKPAVAIRRSDGFEYGECRECGQIKRLRQDGMVRVHRR